MCRYGLSKEKISALDITTEPICELAVFDRKTGKKLED